MPPIQMLARVAAAACFVQFLLHSSIVHAENACKVIDSSGRVVLMHCPAGIPNETDWITASRAACGNFVECNVWIWNDATLIPQHAPLIDKGIPPAAAAGAIAVWANADQSLLKLKKRH